MRENETNKSRDLITPDDERQYDKYFARDPRRDRRIVVVDGKRCDLPTIRFVRKGDDCDGAHVDGMKGLLKKLEDMSGESMARNMYMMNIMIVLSVLNIKC